MKFERTRVNGFENALYGARNPMNSWARSDSKYGLNGSKIDSKVDEDFYKVVNAYCKKLNTSDDIVGPWLYKNGRRYENHDYYEYAYIGPNDLDLAQRLCKAGPEHRKFLRQIQVSVQITAPLYWWKEADTYKLGTTSNSTSTMHKLASTPITIDCFETDDYEPHLTFETGIDDRGDSDYPYTVEVGDVIGDKETSYYNWKTYIGFLESLRQKYNETKDKRYWKELIRWLPESWLQTRMITMNYENVRSICAQRQGHRLTEWASFIAWARELPYADVLIFDEDIKTLFKKI